jgi:GH24 family phage-related lysozyme (muramidase)
MVRADKAEQSRLGVTRRGSVLSLAAIALGVLVYPGLSTAKGSQATAKKSQETFKALLAEFESSPELSEQNYAFREYAENFLSLKLERAPSRLSPSKLPISQAAKTLIVSCEISNKSLYKQRYRKPVWPGGMSGVTIGIGYDLGFVNPDLLRSDWAKIIDDKRLMSLSRVCGVTGRDAENLVPPMSGVIITWHEAMRQFALEIAKYVSLTKSHLRNFSRLPENCRGALVSLVYNRGPSFDVPEAKDPSGRYREMRAIRQHMDTQDYKRIPPEISNMARLWPDMPGLVKRRQAEAALFEAGLTQL